MLEGTGSRNRHIPWRSTMIVLLQVLLYLSFLLLL